MRQPNSEFSALVNATGHKPLIRLRLSLGLLLICRFHCAHRAPLPPLGGMHPLAAERRAEYLGVLLFGEHEHLEEPAIAVYRMAVTRQRQPALLAEFPERVEPGAVHVG